MHIFLIFIFLLFTSNAIATEWVPTARYFDPKITDIYLDGVASFFDQDSIKYKGNLVKYWLLVDKKKKDKAGAKSFKAFVEINCIEKEIRYISFISYDGNMGNGSVLLSDNLQTSFTPIVPESQGDNYYFILCEYPFL